MLRRDLSMVANPEKKHQLQLAVAHRSWIFVAKRKRTCSQFGSHPCQYRVLLIAFCQAVFNGSALFVVVPSRN